MKPQTNKLSRRSFGRLLAATPVAARAAPPPQAAALSREEELRAASERRVSASQTLAKFDLPMATEPAFTFQP